MLVTVWEAFWEELVMLVGQHMLSFGCWYDPSKTTTKLMC